MLIKPGLQNVQVSEGVMMHGMSFLFFEFGKRAEVFFHQATKFRP